MTRHEAQQRVFMIQQARDEAFKAGDWERVDFISLFLDDATTELEQLEKTA